MLRNFFSNTVAKCFGFLAICLISASVNADIYDAGGVEPSYTSATDISDTANQWHNRVSTTDAYNVTDPNLTVSISSSTSVSPYSLTFSSSAATSSFVASDVYVTGGTLSSFSGSGSSFSATVTESSSGAAVSIIVPASGFQDNAGNNNTQASLFFDYPNTLNAGADVSKTFGDASYTQAASGGSGNGEVTYASSATSVATVNSSTGAVTMVGAGSATITATRAADANYNAVSDDYVLTVGQAALTVTAEAKSKVYGAADPALTYSISGFVNSDSESNLDTAVSITRAAGDAVGTYTITPSAAADANYSVSFITADLTVGQAALTVTAEAKSKVYGAADPALTYSISGFVNSDSESNLDTAVSITRAAGDAVGTYTITPSAAADANYSVSFITADLTVGQAALTVTAEAKSKVYGAADPALTYSISGFVNSDSESNLDTAVSITRAAGDAVGTYTITPSAAADANYSVSFITADLTVGQAALTVTAEAKSKVYGAADPALTYSISGFVNSDSESNLDTAVSITRAAGDAVGTYTITPSAAADANYSVSFITADLTVGQAALTVTAEAKSKVYGAADPALTYSISGFVNSDSESNLDTAVSITRAAGDAVGTYTITPSAAADANYSVSFITADLTVGQAALTVTAEAKSKVYGAADPALTYSISGFVNSDSESNLDTAVSITRAAGDAVGTYTITPSAAADANYSVSFITADLTVGQAALTVTAEAKSKVYGAADPALTYSISGFVNSDSESNLDTAVSITRAAGDAVGTYTITPSAAADANYSVSFITADLTVGQAALTVTAEAKSKVYGAADPALTYSISGFVNSDSESNLDTAVSITRAAGDAVGTYTITPSAAADANYSVSFITADLTVGQAALTVTAEAKSKVYGAADPALTYSISGFVNSDSESNLDTAVSITRAAGDAVGTYTITPSAAADANYSVSFITADLTVGQAALTVTAEAKSKVYGAADPALTYSISGFVNSDSESNLDTAVSITRAAGDAVGTYTITPSAAADANYSVSFITADLTVGQAALTVTAEAKSKVYGAADPALTYSISGFVNSDSESNLDTAVSITRAAGDAVGTYTITPSAAADANYSVSFITADLTVGQAALTVTAEAKSKVYGAADPALTYSISGFVNSDSESNLDTAVSITRAAGDAVGTYTITPSAAADANYSVSFITADLTVGQAALTVTAEAKSKVYGAADPALTYSISGFVNSDSESNLDTAVSITRAAGDAVGTYTITPSAAADANYSVSFITADLTVGQAALTVTAEAKSKVYGAADPALTYSISGFVNSDSESNLDTAVSITRAAGDAVGTYTITPSAAADANYSVSFITADLTVGQAALTVTAEAKSKVYGAADPALTYSISGFVNSDSESNLDTAVSITRAAGDAVGTYTITPSAAADANYSVSFITADLTVGQAALTVTAEAKSKVYGAADPALTYSISGFVNSDSESNLDTAVSITRAAGDAVGTYTITPSAAADANYSVSFITADLTVGQAALTVTAEAKSKVYGAADPALTYSISGFVNSDSESNLDTAVSITRAAGDAVGTYTITPSAAADANYSVSFITADLTVGQAALTVTAEAKSKVYGAADPALTYSISGFVNSDSESNLDTAVSITRAAGDAVGTYTITPSAAADANYSVSFITADLTVGQAALTVTAEAKSKVYGAADPALTYSISGFVNSDSESNLDTAVSITRAAGDAVGTYTITPSAAADANYSVSFITADLTVGQAALTVTADDITKTKGTSDPALTYSITTGSLETGDSFTGVLSRVVGEDVGTYAIALGTLTAGANYTVTFVPAVFIIVENPTMVISANVSNNDVTTDEFINVTFVSSETTNDFNNSDVTVTNGSLSAFSGSGTTYSATFTASADGATTIRVNNAVYTGTSSALDNVASDIFNWTSTYDAYLEVTEDVAGNANAQAATDIQINSLEGVSGARVGIDYTTRFNEASYGNSTAPTAAEIQGVVDYVSLLVDIGYEADSAGTGIDFTTGQLTANLGLSDVTVDNQSEYNSYIDDNAGQFSAPATFAEVQGMVHIVNVVEAAGLASLTSPQLVLAGVDVNPSTDPVNTLSAAELTQVSSDINAANPVTTADLQDIAELVVTPVISLNGSATISIERGTFYNEPGASSADAQDSVTNPTVSVGGDVVDTSSVGAYTVTYSATDAAGNAATQVTRTVNVVDTTAPVITVTTGTDTVERGSAWTDAGATTTEGTISTSGSVNTAVAGTYTITYSAIDAAGNTGTATRTVNVVDNTAPVITVTTGTDTVERGSAWTDAGATTTEGTISTSGSVNTAVAGTYTITYSAIDAAGNTGTATRAVNVVDTTAPVITVTTGTDTVERGSAWTDAGATTTEGTISTSGSVNTAVAGTYTITYSAIDAAGNTGTATRTVNVVDNTAPVITVTTGTDTVERGSAWTDAGATTTEGTISTSGSVNTAVAGTYTITYSAIDAAGNTGTATRAVNVVDTTAPVITVTTGTDTVERGSAWTDAGATTTEGTISTSGSVNTAVAGTYTITYSAIDAAGNTGTATRAVNVVDTTAPVITVTTGTDTVERGSAWTDAGATTTEGTISTSGSVNTAVAGTYTITYSAIDAAGNTGTATRTVNVVDTTAPVITVTTGTDTVERGSAWTDAGATTTEGTISTSGSVNTAVAGTYTITYSAIDAAGNTGTATRAVNVVDTTAPVITVTTGTDTVERGSAWTDAGATTTEGTISTSGSVNTAVAGTYTITYSAIDAAGNTGTATRAVNVVDTTAPVITVTGDNPATVEQGATYSDVGAMADGGESVTSSGTVDTSTVGAYTITYSAIDVAGNTGTATRAVNVVDTTAPVITLTGESSVTAELGENYADQGASAVDNNDGDISAFIATTNPVNTQAVGSYTVTYNVSDAAGNAATPVTRTVIVADTVAPVITLQGDAELTLEVGDTFTDAGATATDAVDGDLSDDIVVTGSVDTTSVGSYILTYNVSDTAGNAATPVTRAVVVNEIPITTIVPDDITVNAVGYLTAVDLDPQDISFAVDGDGNTLAVTPDQFGPFQSGTYEIIWSATNGTSTVTETQILKVVPLVNLGTPITTTEGNNLTIDVILSGTAADYPVSVPFTISGTAVEGEDYTVDPSGMVTISDGTQGVISLSIITDDIAESEESVVITIGEPLNASLGVLHEQIVTIAEENLAPKTALMVSQGDVIGTTVTKDQGLVTATADIDDANADDVHTINWASALNDIPNASVDPETQALIFDPADLDVGVTEIAAEVSDGTNIVTVYVDINIIDQAPVLSDQADSDGDGLTDADEGVGDIDGDNIPDYQDSISNPNVIAADFGVLQSEPGTIITLGARALATGRNVVSLLNKGAIGAHLLEADPAYEFANNLIDFELNGAEFGHSYRLVVPLEFELNEGAVYRKYVNDIIGWQDFIYDANNDILSTIAVDGACPAPGSDVYTPGLTAGYNCIELVIEEGGPNDADGIVNGNLVDPGGVADKYIGTPSELSEVRLRTYKMLANGVDTTVITVNAYDADGVRLDHMSVSASSLLPGAQISEFTAQGNGVYTAILTAGNVVSNGPVTVVIDNGEVSVSLRSDRLRLETPGIDKPLSSGGCTVATNGSTDASLLLLLIMSGLLLVRRRYRHNI